MSTKKEMLGKENRKENGHRRYSLLLLALLFIGFATYGTYAYFTSSASTTKGHLTLNGLYTGKQTLGDDSGFEKKEGDGLADTNTPIYTPSDNDANGGNGHFDSKSDKDNVTEFGEFDWVYVGNVGSNGSNVSIKNSAPSDFTAFNKAITVVGLDNGKTFNKVVGGDVFRKTARILVKSTDENDTTASNLSVEWKQTAESNDILTKLAVADMTVKIGDSTGGKAVSLAETSGDTVSLLGKNPTTKVAGTIKPKQFVEIDLLVQTKNDATISSAEQNLLAQIARQVAVRVSQDTTIVNK
ncbi:hypothetical protein [Enterococcus cecorum]|uniref:hypothetical protein n=1 Tax=Enterococcus cecorum TaxID=44008 RepID=UPI001FAB5B8C|nr:hypothetical protein [Enterococcus cecorum]MCJ0574700.1 hypothetical protein [Enterococcus cecorum]MCJ0576495.1 hypothetical protein [Enterococcus cecorum]